MKQPSETAGATDIAQIQLLRVADILPDPNNRKGHDPAELQLLAESIERDGLLQPIVVRDREPNALTAYMIVAGERRWEAHRLLGREMIEARVVTPRDVTESIRKRAAENFHRVDLSPIEKAKQLVELFDSGMDQQAIAEFIGAKDQSTVSNFTRLLKLPADVQELVHKGQLTNSHAKALLRFEKWPAVLGFIAQKAAKEGASSKALEKGLPFAEDLENKELVFGMGWLCAHLNNLPAQYRMDPDFVEGFSEWEDSSVYCLDLEKGKAAAELISATAAARSVRSRGDSSAGGSEAGEKPGMTAAEIAARKELIAKNKAARAEITDTFERARIMVGCATIGSIGEHLERFLTRVAIADGRHSSRLKEAAGLIEIKWPRGGLAEVPVGDAMRVAALAVMLRERDDALRFVGDVPDSLQTFAQGVEIKAPAAAVSAKAVKTQVERELAAGRKKRTTITDDTRSEVRRLYEAGRTGAEIAAAVGISLPSVQNIKKALGFVKGSK
jgi:ParB/RepB/Spo0J family partition protein